MSNEMNFEQVRLIELANNKVEAGPGAPVVLVVDDEKVIADTLVAILSQRGFVAMAAYSGKEALEIARVVPPNLLLTDVVMPGMNGVELAIAIKNTIPDCAVLLFSGQAATADRLRQAHAMGRNFTVLEKPVHPTELLARISESLEMQMESAV